MYWKSMCSFHKLRKCFYNTSIVPKPRPLKARVYKKLVLCTIERNDNRITNTYRTYTQVMWFTCDMHRSPILTEYSACLGTCRYMLRASEILQQSLLKLQREDSEMLERRLWELAGGCQVVSGLSTSSSSQGYLVSISGHCQLFTFVYL